MRGARDADDPAEIPLERESVEEGVDAGENEIDRLPRAALDLVPEPVSRPRQRQLVESAPVGLARRRREEGDETRGGRRDARRVGLERV